MATGENKVQFNLKNVHYAVITELSPTPTFDTPVAVPGAVSLSLEQQGELTKFYADGIVYYQSSSNNGYEGDLEMARFPDQMYQDIWGDTLSDTDNVLMENANTQPNPFALLFQIDGDVSRALYCLYNCTATRPNIEGETTNESKEPKTATCTVSAVPLPDGNVRAKTTATTTEGVITNWFKKVYMPSAAAAAAATANVPATAEAPEVAEAAKSAAEPNMETENTAPDSVGG